MHYTLSDLSYYDKAYEIKKKMVDEQNYMMGVYNYKALETAFYNFSLGFDTKHKKKKAMPYLKQPFLYKEEEKEMTEEEIQEAIQKEIFKEEMWIRNSRLKGLPETVIN